MSWYPHSKAMVLIGRALSLSKRAAWWMPFLPKPLHCWAACGEGSASGTPVGGFFYFLPEDFLEPPWIFALPVSKAAAFGLLLISFSSLAMFILPPSVFNPG